MNKLKHSSGTIEFTRAGHAYLISESKNVDKDIFIPRERTGKALSGDKVFVKLFPKNDGTGEYTGEVQGIVKRFKTEFVGTLEKLPIIGSDIHIIKTFSKKQPIEIVIYPEGLGEGKVGDKVVVAMTRWNKTHNKPNGIVKTVLGKAGEHNTEINSILFENNIDSRFPESVLREAEEIPFEISEEEIANREDFRNILTFTIDPDTAKDFDDALSFRILPNKHIEVGVHIADVAHYIKPGSNLDNEAYRRSTSTYLVDRCIPMLPERLSNGVCSLRPNEDKLAFSVIFEIFGGEIVKTRFAKTIINSNIRYSYEDAQKIIEGPKKEKSDGPQLYGADDIRVLSEEEGAIVMLDRLAKSFRAERFKKGAVSFEKKEVKFKLDPDGSPIGLYFKESKDSNKLIEEFMLLANVATSEFIGKKGLPCIYRTHALPTLERLQELSVFVAQFGYELKVSDNTEQNKTSLNKLLLDVKNSNHANIIETVAVRSMSKAIYSTEITGHYGLGFKYYSHFTSPIRRYPDVILHRILFRLISNQPYLAVDLQTQCQHCSELENKAAKAERDSIRFKQVEYLQKFIGDTFEGVVSGVTNFGLFVELKENGCDGLVNLDELANLDFVLDEKNYKFVSDNGKISLGDSVKVKINNVNLTKRQVDLSLVD
jgi:ribonuclease R